MKRFEYSTTGEYETAKIHALVRLLKYLIARADQRGLSHGEKHQYLIVALQECDRLLAIVEPGGVPLFERHNDADPVTIPDIPF